MKLLFFLTAASVGATTFFEESFDTLDNWVQPKGNFGKFVLDGDVDTGLWTSEKAQHYVMFAPMQTVEQTDHLAVQYSIRLKDTTHACGGAYLKLTQTDAIESITSTTPYHFMFGPDFQCNGRSKVHAIFNKKPDTHWNKAPSAQLLTDGNPHAFTFLLFSNNTYAYKVDGEMQHSGSLETDWPLLEPASIPDPAVRKPLDWPLRTVPDPDNPQPEGWDAMPEHVDDPDATMPYDWDIEDDGEWEAPSILNPERSWTPSTVPNPEYSEWKHPLIDNPAYLHEPNLYQQLLGANAIGFEIWSLDNGVVFDDILVTNDVEKAATHVRHILNKKNEFARFEDRFEENKNEL